MLIQIALFTTSCLALPSLCFLEMIKKKLFEGLIINLNLYDEADNVEQEGRGFQRRRTDRPFLQDLPVQDQQ